MATTDEARPPLLSGLLLDQLADAFRVRPLLKGSLGRQLREWRQGEPKERETQRKIIRAILEPIFGDGETAAALGGPISDRELGLIAEQVLLRWCVWLDRQRPTTEQVELTTKWIIEHTLRLWGIVVGTVRHAWGKPLAERPGIADWSPTGFDDTPIPAQLLDEVLARLENDRSQVTVKDRLATTRKSDDGQATKPDTLKRWRRGASVPNGERVDAIAQVAADPLFRIKLGVRNLVEKLAGFNGEGPNAAQNRNATTLWLAHAECRALLFQRALTELNVTPADALWLLADDKWLTLCLPSLTAATTSADLPFDMWKMSAMLIEVRQDGERKGLVIVRQPASVAFVFAKDGEEAIAKVEAAERAASAPDDDDLR